MSKKIVLSASYSPINFTDVVIDDLYVGRDNKVYIRLYNSASKDRIKGNIVEVDPNTNEEFTKEINQIVIEIPAFVNNLKEQALTYIANNNLLSQMGLEGSLQDD